MPEFLERIPSRTGAIMGTPLRPAAHPPGARPRQPPSPLTRPEAAADPDAVRQVHRLAFGRDDEARPGGALGSGGYARLSLVAENDG
jgi:hypothetical protein